MLLPSGSDQSIKPNKTMTAIKTFTCAIAAAVTLAFFTPSIQARPITTTANDIILSLTMTVYTNGGFGDSLTNFTATVGQTKFTTKNLLQLLGGGNGFSTETFSNGDQIAIAYDFPWNGDVVVVDKTGTNVLFDATKNLGNTNATLAISLLNGDGVEYRKVDIKAGGIMSFTTYYGGTFTLQDYTNNIDFNLTASGPSTFKFTQTLIGGKEYSATNMYASWNDSVTFNFFGANNESVDDHAYVTISGTITGKSNGKGENGYMVDGFFF
jgi:hypothetical protein